MSLAVQLSTNVNLACALFYAVVQLSIVIVLVTTKNTFVIRNLILQ